MRSALDPAAASRLAKLLGLTGSAHDGEALAAARMASKLRKSLGLQGQDIIRLPPAQRTRHDEGWRALVRSALIVFTSSMSARLIS